MPRTLTKSTYQTLVTDLRSIIDKGRERAFQAITDIRVKTYWDLGKRLHKSVARALRPASSDLIQRLAEDLHLDPQSSTAPSNSTEPTNKASLKTKPPAPSAGPPTWSYYPSKTQKNAPSTCAEP